jgi:ATP-dependent DNA ligase
LSAALAWLGRLGFVHIRRPFEPMLATLVDRLPSPATGGRAGLRYEPKWDGFRAIALVNEERSVELYSRRLKPMGAGFPDVRMAVYQHLPPETVVDGELVCWVDGRLDFGALQRRNAADGRAHDIAQQFPCHYVVFDLLEREGEDLRTKPLAERRRQLEDVFADAPRASALTLGMHTADRAEALVWFEKLRDVGVEGLVVKNAGERYRAGARGWLKVKAYATADAIIGGVIGALARPEQVVLGRYDSATGEFRMVARTVPILDHLADQLAGVLTEAGADHRGPSCSPGSGSAGRALRRTYASNPRSSPRSASTPPPKPAAGVTAPACSGSAQTWTSTTSHTTSTSSRGPASLASSP